jgi:hypothetical protein
MTEKEKCLGYVIQDLTFDEPVYLGANNVAVSKIRAAKIFVDELHAKSERFQHICEMKKLELECNGDPELIKESRLAIVPVLVLPAENEIMEALQNIMGIVNTPIGRRKLGDNEFLHEVINNCCEVIMKYKV